MEKDNVANIPETEQKEFKAQFVQDWNKVLAKYEHITGRQAIEIALEFFIQKYQELQARTKNWHSRKPG